MNLTRKNLFQLTLSPQAQTISFEFMGLISIDVIGQQLFINISSLQCCFRQWLFVRKSYKRIVQSSENFKYLNEHRSVLFFLPAHDKNKLGVCGIIRTSYAVAEPWHKKHPSVECEVGGRSKFV